MKAVVTISAMALLALAATAASARDWDLDFTARDPAVKQAGHYEWAWDGKDSLSLEAHATMHYTPEGAPRIVITGPDELLSHIRVGQGHIRFERDRDWHYEGGERLQVTVTGVTVHDIALSGSGQADLEKLNLDHLDLTVSGSGSVTGEGRSDRLNLTVSGSGRADVSRLAAREAEVKISGSGSAATGRGLEQVGLSLSGAAHVDLGALQARETRIQMSGSGRVNGGGSSDRVMLSMSGHCTADLGQLQAREADIRISGNGRAMLTPRDTARVTISGAGTVVMAARPASLSQSISGSGSVRIGER
jgi:hypothetical protein